MNRAEALAILDLDTNSSTEAIALRADRMERELASAMNSVTSMSERTLLEGLIKHLQVAKECLHVGSTIEYSGIGTADKQAPDDKRSAPLPTSANQVCVPAENAFRSSSNDGTEDLAQSTVYSPSSADPTFEGTTSRKDGGLGSCAAALLFLAEPPTAGWFLGGVWGVLAGAAVAIGLLYLATTSGGQTEGSGGTAARQDSMVLGCFAVVTWVVSAGIIGWNVGEYLGLAVGVVASLILFTVFANSQKERSG